jgi:alkanesulfonate monooxygenase SsuD/methylene tetrahydromethanopterin reductase-like flavin-dependent oxidoreductase (luciferase family)
MDDSQDTMRQDGSMVEEQMEGMGQDPISADAEGSAQAKKHAREMRAMQDQLANLQAQLGSTPNYHEQPTNPYHSPGQPNQPTGSEEERIQRAVRYALDAKDAESRRAKEAESHAHVQKQYQRLQDEFDKASDKYDDFDELVRGDAPFTSAMRDALLLVGNPAEVAYKLGKNRSELSRLSQLHPLDQAREITNLSFALMNGNNGKSNSSSSANPLNPLKSNPVANTGAITDKTPASSIRARMKAGTWK